MKFHELRDLIGEESATKLCEMYGGCQEKIPKPPRTERNAQIMRMFKGDVPRKTIAAAFGLNYSTVCKIISKG
ncbi:protein of unknown function [Pseudodesulfovibrio profundus]|uniref:Mor transcription activator domain-containing protein n=1 Tax=Pseudodesulfovibrio profundus TaxID=57320 RepID=A0A2C8FCX0_9BACT|nr:helix-turn-helix domain-containing protein [Pseudodesulfovibrio profundus]SOB60624.1 protein of unknown function [Pseudodesulfovibrio profundus]